MMRANEKLVLALPKGRILDEVMPVLARAGIEIEPAFDDPDSRQLRFDTNDPGLDVIRVRNFDVATFVAFGAAQLGVAGNDVLMEFDYPEIYVPLDLSVGHCRLVVAAPKEDAGADDPPRWSHVRIATKYPEITRRHFAARGVQAECIKLQGAMELAPTHRPVPPDRRSGADRHDLEGERPRRDRAHRRRDLAPHRQPRRAQDPRRRGQCLDRALPRGGRCRLGSTRAIPVSKLRSRFLDAKRELEEDVDAPSPPSSPMCARAATRR